MTVHQVRSSPEPLNDGRPLGSDGALDENVMLSCYFELLAPFQGDESIFPDFQPGKRLFQPVVPVEEALLVQDSLADGLRENVATDFHS